MKKVSLILLACVLLLSGCGEPIPTEAQQEAAILALSDELIRCLSEEDRDGFDALFYEEIRSLPEFECQADALFEFFETANYTPSQYLRYDWSAQAFSASIVYIQDPVSLPDGTPWHWFYELQIRGIPAADSVGLPEIHSLTVIRSNDGRQFQVGTHP